MNAIKPRVTARTRAAHEQLVADFATSGVELRLTGGHRMQLERGEGADALRLVSPDGSVPITIEISERGVVLRLDAPNIALDTRGDVSISADHLSVHGRSSLSVTSNGDISVDAEGELHSRAIAQQIAATRGDVAVRAGDDVTLNGERVMVNCDVTAERYFRNRPT